MGEDGRGVRLAMPATWVLLILFTVTSVRAVEGRCAKEGHLLVFQLAQGELIHAQWVKQETSEDVISTKLYYP